MSLTGSGVGGNIGGPQVPLQRDLEATSWTEINKAVLGITADTLEKSFTQINPRYTSGYYGGYKSSEGQPLLDHPLESGRIAQGFDPLADETWKVAYNNFIKQLPDELQQEFIAEGQKPFDERKGSFTALDNLLMLAAKMTTVMTFLSLVELGPLETERALFNQVLPFTALRGAITQGTAVTDSALAYVQSQGPNDPFFDTYTNALTQMGYGVQNLQQLASQIKQSGMSKQLNEWSTQLAKNLYDLNDSLNRTNLGGNLQILNSTLRAMTVSAEALSLYQTGSASLFLGLSLSSIGLKTSESESGIIGNALSKVTEGLSSGLISSLIPPAPIANQHLLEMSLTTGFASLIGIASLAIDPGFGIFPSKDPTYIKSSRFFAFELALLLMNSSGVLKQVFTPLLQASGANGQATETSAEILSQVGNFLIILAGTRDGRQNPAHLVDSTSKYLEKGVIAANHATNASEINDLSNATMIALQQSQIALEAKDYEGFLDAFTNLLEALGITSENLAKDINVINKQTRTIFQANDNDTQPDTAVVNFV